MVLNSRHNYFVFFYLEVFQKNHHQTNPEIFGNYFYFDRDNTDSREFELAVLIKLKEGIKVIPIRALNYILFIMISSLKII